MSEKRFSQRLGEGHVHLTHIYDNGEEMMLDEIVDLLNKLYEENKLLRTINKEIGDDLYSCRLNKNIISEKLKAWQDIHKKYNIYSAKDFEELMKE